MPRPSAESPKDRAGRSTPLPTAPASAVGTGTGPQGQPGRQPSGLPSTQLCALLFTVLRLSATQSPTLKFIMSAVKKSLGFRLVPLYCGFQSYSPRLRPELE